MFIKIRRRMIYKFDDVDIKTYGVLPARGDGGYAISGIFDFPKRKGEVERNWGDGIEPYLEEEDLEYGERTIGLKVVMENLADWERFRAAAVACRKLGTELGEHEVVLADAVGVETVGNRVARIEMKFREYRVAFEPLTVVATGGAGIRVDGYHLARDFGISVKTVKGDRDVARRIEVSTTDPYTITRYRERGTMTLECVMRGADLREAARRMRQFHALWRQAGTRMLHLADGRTREVYLKDGFSASIAGDGVLKFNLKLDVYD